MLVLIKVALEWLASIRSRTRGTSILRLWLLLRLLCAFFFVAIATIYIYSAHVCIRVYILYKNFPSTIL
jgi:hypothetical protein